MGDGLKQVFLWAQDDPAYAIAVVVGLVAGAMFIIEAWRSDPKSAFKDTPRVTTLLLLFGPAALAILGDVGALDNDAKKTVVLMFYFAALFAGAVVTLLSIALLIVADRTFAWWRGNSEGYGIIRALLDYIFHGYEYCREVIDTASLSRPETFHAACSSHLSVVITAAASATKEKRAHVRREILLAITAIVKHYRTASDEHRIRSNVMVLRAASDDLRKRVTFVGTGGEMITRCLVLDTYDEPTAKVGLVLPIPPDDDRERALPGAPLAVLGADGYDVIDDTANLKLGRKVPAPIRKGITQYFSGQEFKSFGSIRIVGPGGVVGVLNVESAAPAVFGPTDSDKRKIVKYLAPFCAALGMILDDRP